MIIAISGIKRSASTVQYNLVRIALEHAGYKVNPCKHGYEPRKVPQGEVDLVKRHPYKRSIALKADHIFLTTRPDEEILASLKRFNGNAKKERIPAMRKQLAMWFSHTTEEYYFHYHHWTKDPMIWAEKVVELLGVDADPKAVLDEFNQIEPPEDEYDPVTCLFPGHITKPS